MLVKYENISYEYQDKSNSHEDRIFQRSNASTAKQSITIITYLLFKCLQSILDDYYLAPNICTRARTRNVSKYI